MCVSLLASPHAAPVLSLGGSTGTASAAATLPRRAESEKVVIRTVFIPKSTDSVMDLAGILDRDSIKRIERAVRSTARETGAEVRVLTTDSLSGVGSPKKFATDLFNTWRVGGVEKNNGCLVLVVTDARRIEVEIGMGLNQEMPARWITTMLEEVAVPAFKAGFYGPGVANVVEALETKLEEVDPRLPLFPRQNGVIQARGASTGELVNRAVQYGLVGLGSFYLITGKGSSKSFLPCEKCGGRGTDEVTYDPRGFLIVEDATEFADGFRVQNYTCTKCGHTGVHQKTIRRYDTYRNGRGYYRQSSSDNDGAGGSSDGGGGGASW